jgi:hypothetical protein
VSASDLNTKLVADLARLVTRYSPDDWRTLLLLFENEETRKLVVLLLDELAHASARRRSSNSPSRSTTSASIRQRLDEMGEAEPAHAHLLADLWARIRSRELLPEMSNLRVFSEEIGMKTLASRNRDQAASEVIGHLMNISEMDLKAALKAASAGVERKLGEEYENWVRLILDRDSAP